MSIAEWRIWRGKELAHAFDASHALSDVWKKKIHLPSLSLFLSPSHSFRTLRERVS